MKVKRLSLSEQVKDAVLDRIVKGRYKPGDRLTELAIAKEFETSQVTVREAFSKLEAMSFLESKPHRGTFVREITDREMGESTMVRGVLEEAAAVEAAGKLKEKIAELRTENKGMTDALQRNDMDGVAQHNVNFHRMIIQATDNNVLIKVWESLAFEAKSRLCANRAAQSMILMGIKSNDAIIEAFERGDGVAAGKMLRNQSMKCGLAQTTATTRITQEEFQRALKEAGVQLK